MKYVSTFVDRRGTLRRRFRKAGCKPRYLKSEPGTPAFEAEIEAAVREVSPAATPAPYREPSSLVFLLDMLVTCQGFDPSGAYIYFVEAENGLVKIGFSCCLRHRFKTMQTCSPLPLKIIGLHRGDQALERLLHRRFARHRVRGEWFAGAEEIRRYAASTNEEQRLTILSNLQKMAEISQGGDPYGTSESSQFQALAHV